MVFLIQNISFSYDQEPIIADCSYKFGLKPMVHLCGANGSGKTTLLKLIAGILKPEQGELLISEKCAYVGHQLGLHPNLSPLENIKASLENYDTKALDSLLKASQLYGWQYKPCKTLSLGQQHKVAFIRMALSQTELWLLDEPFANLDSISEAWLWSLFNSHVQAKGRIIFTAHQRDFKAQGVDIWQI